MKTFGEKLREARKKQGLSQQKLAELLGLKNHNAISNWENNIAKPEADTLIKLAEIIKASTDYLLGTKTYTIPEESQTINIAMEDYIEYLTLKNEKLKQENQSLTENASVLPTKQ